MALEARPVTQRTSGDTAAPVLWWLALAWLSFGEHRIFERLLFVRRTDVDFVTASVDGVLSGHPAFKSWQHRFLPIGLVKALEGVTRTPIAAHGLFLGLTGLLANLLLFWLLRRKGATPSSAFAAVVVFGLAHVLTAYTLEYPWDGIDVLLFAAFGYLAAQRASLFACTPLLLVGLLNHETVLYIPLWYALGFAQPSADESQGRGAREVLVALFVLTLMAGVVFAVREAFYVGPPALPGATDEPSATTVQNQIHVAHNLRMLAISNWKSTRAWVSVTFVASLVALGMQVVRKRHVRAALWSSCVLGAIVCFGYVNETRLYLGLIAFWVAYAWPTGPTAARDAVAGGVVHGG